MNRKDEKLCPVCGAEMPQSWYELVDGTVCNECEKYLRFAYPVIYVPNPHPNQKCRPDLDELFEKEQLTNRQKADMIDELRNLPLNRIDLHPKSYYTIDRMHGLTIEQFQEEIERVDSLRNLLSSQYFDYDNVCAVVQILKTSKRRASEGIAEMRKYRNTYKVSGMLRLGKFRPGDFVTVYRDGMAVLETEVLETAYVAGCLWKDEYGTDVSSSQSLVTEGHQVQMILSREAEKIVPGDLLVSDD